MKRIKPYKDYKDSGISWLGYIPSNWKITRLKYIFQIQKRIVGELGYNVLSITQNGIKVKDIISGSGQLSMDYSKYQIIFEGEYGMNHMDLLTGYVDLSKYDGVISPDYRVFSLIENNSDKRYLLKLLQLCYKNKIFYSEGQGAAQFGRWRMPSDNFKNFFFPLPSLNEQNNIANFLDYKIAKIDRFISKKKQILSLNIERRKSFTSQILKSNTVQFIRISEITELIQRPIEIIDNEMFTPIGLYNRGRGIFHKLKTPGKDLGDSSFFYVKEGDVVFSGQFAWEGAVALASNSDNNCIASHRYPILKCNPTVILPEFLYSFFTISEGHLLLDNHSRGAAGRNRPLNPRNLIKEKIPIPSISLQKKLVKIVKNEIAFKSTIEKEIALVQEYKTVLIAEAVTGKIDVRDYVIPIFEEETEMEEEGEEELDLVEDEDVEIDNN